VRKAFSYKKVARKILMNLHLDGVQEAVARAVRVAKQVVL